LGAGETNLKRADGLKEGEEVIFDELADFESCMGVVSVERKDCKAHYAKASD
jgi:hypothetical protein